MGRTFGVEIRSRAALAAALSLALAGCQDARRGADEQRAPAARAAVAAALPAADAPVCTPTGAHGAHAALPRGCETCHPCGGNFGFPDDLVMPRGTTTAGGAIVRGTTGTTCSVGCHSPLGAPATTVSWTQGGPLACTSCHVKVVAAGARSKHAVASADVGVDRNGCQACHVLTAHTSGTVRISLGDGTTTDVRPGDPAAIDSACKACHDGSGNPVGGRTPPLLVGWAAQDFHGARAGTGWGGTLAPPYARGQAPLPCETCHADHGSDNAFLFAASVDGAPMPPLTIDRQGVGAQALCEACHQGARHQGCIDCHGVDPMPAGAPCFYCHGHEGVKSFVWPSPTHDTNHPNPGCQHCHGDWMPSTIDRVPPVVASGGLVVVKNVTGSAATVEWTTDEPSTSYVEYGVGTPGSVAGTDALATRHSVALGGLAASQEYVLRVRSSDAFRNVTVSALQAFTTVDPHAPPAPVLVHLDPQWVCDPSAPVTLAWGAVADPDGDPVQYRLVLDDGVGFDSPLVDSGWITGTRFATAVLATEPPTYYYWRVQARDAAHGLPSPWSAVDTFAGVLLGPNDCY